MVKGKTNLAASVHQRLLNKAKESSRPFNELLQYFVIERFVYRAVEVTSQIGSGFLVYGQKVWGKCGKSAKMWNFGV